MQFKIGDRVRLTDEFRRELERYKLHAPCDAGVGVIAELIAGRWADVDGLTANGSRRTLHRYHLELAD